MAITQWILGIRPEYDGLRIAPVIPREWDGFNATRIFRGVTYHIHVKRAGDGNAISLVVDGVPVEGTVIPVQEGKDAVTVEVTIH